MRGRTAWAPAALLLGFAAGILTGCAEEPVAPYRGQAATDRTVYVVAASWHTEIGLAGEDIGGPLGVLKGRFPEAHYLVFGWGAEDYYMTPHPDLSDLLRAVIPGPAVMLVIPLDSPPAEAFGGDTRVYAIPAARAGLARLSEFLWRYLSKQPDGTLRAAGSGLYPGSVFYAAEGTYDIAHTCNTFTAEGLRAAGLPVDPSGVVKVEQVTDQLDGIGRRER